MDWDNLGLKCVEVRDGAKVFEVQLPPSVPNDKVRLIATLAKTLEEGLSSLDLCDVDGRLTIYLTIGAGGFPLAIDTGEGEGK